MKYTVTILLEAGTYEEIIMDVPVDIEETWEHFLTNLKVRQILNEYNNYQVIDIDPQIDFRELSDYNKTIEEEPINEEL